MARAAGQRDHRVVIVGAGFAGYNAARELSRLASASTEIVVINSADAHLVQARRPRFGSLGQFLQRLRLLDDGVQVALEPGQQQEPARPLQQRCGRHRCCLAAWDALGSPIGRRASRPI